MQSARGEFLARAGRTDDQNPAIGLGGAVDGLAQLIHASRPAGQDAGGRRQLLEFLDLAFQPRGLQRPRRDQNQPVGLERFFDEVVGAALDGGDRRFDIAVAGDHHHRKVGMVALDLLEQLQPIELAALQPDVEEHQARPAVGDLRERRIAVARGPCRKSLVVENPRDKVTNVGFVIDNQNITCHRIRPYLVACCSFGFGFFISRFLLPAGFLSGRLCFSGSCAVPAGCAVSAAAAWPDIANRSRIHAPRAPGRISDASWSSIRPPWSSRTRPTIASPRPVPFSRVVT